MDPPGKSAAKPRNEGPTPVIEYPEGKSTRNEQGQAVEVVTVRGRVTDNIINESLIEITHADDDGVFPVVIRSNTIRVPYWGDTIELNRDIAVRFTRADHTRGAYVYDSIEFVSS